MKKKPSSDNSEASKPPPVEENCSAERLQLLAEAVKKARRRIGSQILNNPGYAKKH